MIPQRRRRRSIHALLISLIIYLSIAIALAFIYYQGGKGGFEEAVEVELLDEKDLLKSRRETLKPPPPKRIRVPRQVQSSIAHQPQTVKLTPSANLVSETPQPSEQLLLHNATPDQVNPQDQLPDVTTAAERLNNREARISETVSTRYQTSDGEGVESHRQRAKGSGKDGIHALESTGASDIGVVGNRPGKRGSGHGGGSATSDNSSESPFAEALRRIAEHIIATRTKDQVDVVFVLDTSASMRDNIQQVADNLFSMTDAFDEVNIEYFLGMTEFSVRQEGQVLKRRPLVPDVGMLRYQMRKIQLSGDEHALDAMVDTFNSMEFRSNADKFLVLVTDEPATTRLGMDSELDEMRQKVIDSCQLNALRVNVLGHTEKYQTRLAEETDGLWQEIPGGLRQRTSLPASRTANEGLVRTFRTIVTDIRRNAGALLFSLDLEFQAALDDHGDILTKKLRREFQNHNVFLSDTWRLAESATTLVRSPGEVWVITDHASGRIYTIRKEGEKLNVYLGVHPEASTHQIADIVIMLDYSRSMGGKSEAIMLGISTLIGRLHLLPIDYQIGLIRFAEPKDAIKTINGVDVTQMPLGETAIQDLMALPFGGDEHLTDAIVKGLPQVRFRRDASRFILVLTDEATTGTVPPERAITLCQSLGVRAYVIGVPREGDFQLKLPKQTGGLFFRMPKHQSQTYPYQ
jgi:Mg-chelatase subunit ChlD